MKKVFQKNTFLLLLIPLFFFASCEENTETEKKQHPSPPKSYAKRFTVTPQGAYKKITLYDKENRPKDTYFLVSKEKKIPEKIKNETIIRTPVKSWVCLSTTHIAFLNTLGAGKTIKGASGLPYIYDKNLRKRIDAGKIKEVGFDAALDYETILRLQPELVTVFNLNGAGSPIIAKLRNLGLHVIEISEYLEESPLGQAEWLLFFAELLEKPNEGKKIFEEISKKYITAKKRVANLSDHPSVLVNMPWKGTWYIPGGKSNIARLIADAGGNYLWKETEETHTLALSIEDVFRKAGNADIWLNPGQAATLEQIKESASGTEHFSALKKGKIFNRDKRLNAFGGNDYMESGTVRPDLILNDLIQILHPDLKSVTDTLYYYRKLQ